jgi:hypothetical protein
MYLPSASKGDKFSTFAIFVAIALGFGARLVPMMADRLDVDIYYMMDEDHKPFIEYTRDGGFGRVLMSYWWIVSRTLGESLFAHRILPLALNLLAILVLVRHVKIAFSSNHYAVLFTILFFALNSRASYTVEYPVINYSVEVLLGGLLYVYVYDICVAQSPFTWKQVCSRSIPIIFLGAIA